MNTIIKTCIIVFVTIVVITVSFYFIAGDSLHRIINISDMVTAKTTCGEIIVGHTIEQDFTIQNDTLEYLVVLGATYDRENDDTLLITILNKDGSVLATSELKTKGLENGGEWFIPLSNQVFGVKGETLTLSVTSQRGIPGNAVTFCYGDSYTVSKFAMEAQISENKKIRVNDNYLDGTLCLSVISSTQLAFGQYYWYGAVVMCLALLLYLIRVVIKANRGENTAIAKTILFFERYGFLIKQLVSRDFKTKYKRSVLGILWSFLNPLFTMLVLYLVFSTLFKSSIDNYPVYLLSGLVCWNFFSEASSMCLVSITGNAALITKVYVPKIVYPLSRAISSLINFLLALVPLFAVLIITEVNFTMEFLLLLFGIVCLFLFSLGIGLFLASAMVFFRDTQFLWGVISMLWMYLTPIFYLESIIPSQWIPLYKMNPLYHIIRIFRIILIDNISPEPKAYLLCLIASLVPLVFGIITFKKAQDKFVLYI